MLKFLEKRKESKLQKECFSVIQNHLSADFRRIYVARWENIADLSDLILYGINSVVKARIDESNSIHIRIEDINGFLFEGFTENYKWFLSTFYFSY